MFSLCHGFMAAARCPLGLGVSNLAHDTTHAHRISACSTTVLALTIVPSPLPHAHTTIPPQTGFLGGIALTVHVGATMQVAAGKSPWDTLDLGPALVLIPLACAMLLGLATLWFGLFVQRRQLKNSNRGPGGGGGGERGFAPVTTPAAAIAAAAGKLSQLLPAASAANLKSGAAVMRGADSAAAGMSSSLTLSIPSPSGGVAVLLVSSERPCVQESLKTWLSSLQQLPTHSTAERDNCLRCVVYGCGPTPLDHATQLAVSAVGAQLGKRGKSGSGQPRVLLRFVRKAQQL